MPYTEPTQIVLTASGPANAVAEHLRSVAQELDAIGPHGGSYGGTLMKGGWVNHEERFVKPLGATRLLGFAQFAVTELVSAALAEPESEDEEEAVPEDWLAPCPGDDP